MEVKRSMFEIKVLFFFFLRKRLEVKIILKRSFARAWNAVTSKTFPHVFAVFQLAALIFSVMPFANSPLIVGGRGDHALKVIMPFHLWVLVFSVTLFALFYRLRREAIEEKSAIAVSFGAAMFSSFNLALHFVDNLLLWMWATEIIATAFYFTIPVIGLYKISNVFLLPHIRRFRKSRKFPDG